MHQSRLDEGVVPRNPLKQDAAQAYLRSPTNHSPAVDWGYLARGSGSPPTIDNDDSLVAAWKHRLVS